MDLAEPASRQGLSPRQTGVSSVTQTDEQDEYVSREAKRNEQVEQIWPGIDKDISDTKKVYVTQISNYNYVSYRRVNANFDTLNLNAVLECLRSKNISINWCIIQENANAVFIGKNLGNSTAIKNMTDFAKNGDHLFIGKIVDFVNELGDLLEILRNTARFTSITIDMELDIGELQVIWEVTRANIYSSIGNKLVLFEPED
jgi:hypothetical protein